MKYLSRPVFYLEESDFDAEGNLTTIPSNKPVFILIQSLGCYHCTQSKPAYHQFAKENPHILCGTIQMDSDKMTQEFVNKIKLIYPNLIGFPSYILHFNGNKIVYDGDRSVEDMRRFISEIL